MEIKPGCNYTVIVDTENFESKVTYPVPGKSVNSGWRTKNRTIFSFIFLDQVGNVYACRHGKELEPVVKVSAKIDSQIMTIHWNLSGNFSSIPNDVSVYISIM